MQQILFLYFEFLHFFNCLLYTSQNMIDMFDRNKVFIAPDLDINMLLALGLRDEEIQEKLNAKSEDNPKNAVFTADDFKPEFIEMLRGDQNTLEMLCSEWADIKDVYKRQGYR